MYETSTEASCLSSLCTFVMLLCYNMDDYVIFMSPIKKDQHFYVTSMT